jgi:hypothetical protein
MRLGSAFLILFLGLLLGVRALQMPSVPLFLLSGLFAGYALVRIFAFRKALGRSGR